MKKGTLEWPPTTVQNEENKGCCSITLFQDKPNSFENVLCGDSFYTFDFKLYKYTHTVQHFDLIMTYPATTIALMYCFDLTLYVIYLFGFELPIQLPNV